jgi:ABC-type transporter Mla maintaining outer membrane lipid asymmetry permease subunit MlaE
MLLQAVPVFAAAAPGRAAAGQGTGALNGTARSSQGQALGNYSVRLRNVQTGQLAGSTTSSAAGAFSFTGLNPGSYVVEIVNAAGEIVGTSAAISVAAGATVGVTVTASAAAALAAGGGAAFFGSTLGIVTLAAAGAGVAAIVVANNRETASPSR